MTAPNSLELGREEPYRPDGRSMHMNWRLVLLLLVLRLTSTDVAAGESTSFRFMPVDTKRFTTRLVIGEIAKYEHEKGTNASFLTIKKADVLIGPKPLGEVRARIQRGLGGTSVRIDDKILGKKVLMLLLHIKGKGYYIHLRGGMPLSPDGTGFHVLTGETERHVPAIKKLIAVFALKDKDKRGAQLKKAVEDGKTPIFLRRCAMWEVGRSAMDRNPMAGARLGLREWRDDLALPTALRLSADACLQDLSNVGYRWGKDRVAFLLSLRGSKKATEEQKREAQNRINKLKEWLGKRSHMLKTRLGEIEKQAAAEKSTLPSRSEKPKR